MGPAQVEVRFVPVGIGLNPMLKGRHCLFIRFQAFITRPQSIVCARRTPSLQGIGERTDRTLVIS